MNKAAKYFPELYLKNRKFAKRMIQEFKNITFDENSKAFHELREFVREPIEEWHKGAYLSDELLDERDEILSKLNKYNFQLPGNPTKDDYAKYNEAQRVKVKTPEWKQWSAWLKKTEGLIQRYSKLEQETQLAQEIIRFNQNGKNIFELSPYLLKLLEKTDVGNIRFKDFVLPYKSIYFHFSYLEGVEYPIECYEEKFDTYLADDYDFDIQEEDEFYKNKKFLLVGAFITNSGDRAIEVCLCFKDPNDSDERTISLPDDHRYPTFNFTLDFSRWDSDASRFVYDSETTFNQSTVVFSDIWDEDAAVSEIAYGKLNELTKERNKCQEFEWEEYVLIDKALKLIVNSICYLNSSEKEIKVSATSEQATILIEQLSKARKSREKQKLQEKLNKHFYSKIHYLGDNLKKYYENEDVYNELEPHWRRGHWRNQPFGKNLSESKLIWIKPTIVRKDRGEPIKGHIYEV